MDVKVEELREEVMKVEAVLGEEEGYRDVC